MTAEIETQSEYEDKNSDEKIHTEEEREVEERNSPTPVPEDDTTPSEPSKQKSPNFLERLFRRQKSTPREQQREAEAGTELLATDDRNKAGGGEGERNNSGTDITIALMDDRPEDAGEAEKEVPPGRANLRRVIFALLIVMIILLVVSLATVLATPADERREPLVNTDPVVVTDCGSVRGIAVDGAYVFRKLPFALPPTETRRWKPPVAPSTLEDCWTGVYEVQNRSVYCHQQPVSGEELDYSEDCLYLDVISPLLPPGSPRPVVVYIHGGSLQALDSSDLQWLPSPRLARDKDVVFVTITYRRNVFGFMSLDVLSSAVHPPTSGNYGFMDQIAALKWVKKNIRSFGGDPSRVTLLGHGAGATSAVVLLSSRKSHDLFTQAWITGPSMRFSEKSLGEVSEENSIFMKKLKCETLECLLGMNSSDLVRETPNSWNLDLTSDFPSTEEEPFPSVAIIDGVLLYDTPLKMWSQMKPQQFPIVLGAMAQEAAATPTTPDASSWSRTDLSDYVSERLGVINPNITGSVLELYIDNSSSPDRQFHTMVADVRVVCPVDFMFRRAKETFPNDVYSYVVDYSPSAPIQMTDDSPHTQMAVHGLDIVAIFGLLDQYLPVLTPADEAYQSNMQSLFYSFVRSGVPSDGQISLKGGDYVNLIHEEVDSAGSPTSRCQLWEDSGLYDTYAKMN